MFQINKDKFKSFIQGPPLNTNRFLDSTQHQKVISALGNRSYQDLLRLISSCTSCPIKDERFYKPVLPKGNLDSYYVVCGRNPGCLSVRTSVPVYKEGNLVNTPIHKIVNDKLNVETDSYSFDSGEVEIGKVTSWFKNGVSENWNRLIWRGGSGGFTDDHKLSMWIS